MLVPSVFRNTVILPFLFYELLAELSVSGLTVGGISEAYLKVYGTVPDDETLKAISDRLVLEARQQEDSTGSGSYSPRRKKVFATGLLEYLSGLQGERLCFFVADYDPMKAKDLFCSADITWVIAAAKEKTGLLVETAQIMFESVLFGMGGSYSGNAPRDELYDLTDDPEAAKGALTKLGLM